MDIPSGSLSLKRKRRDASNRADTAKSIPILSASHKITSQGTFKSHLWMPSSSPPGDDDLTMLDDRPPTPESDSQSVHAMDHTAEGGGEADIEMQEVFPDGGDGGGIKFGLTAERHRTQMNAANLYDELSDINTHYTRFHFFSYTCLVYLASHGSKKTLKIVACIVLNIDYQMTSTYIINSYQRRAYVSTVIVLPPHIHHLLLGPVLAHIVCTQILDLLIEMCPKHLAERVHDLLDFGKPHVSLS